MTAQSRSKSKKQGRTKFDMKSIGVASYGTLGYMPLQLPTTIVSAHFGAA